MEMTRKFLTVYKIHTLRRGANFKSIFSEQGGQNLLDRTCSRKVLIQKFMFHYN